MIIAGVLIETVPGGAARVGALLSRRPDLELHGGDGHSRLAGVWCAETGEALERAAEALLEHDPDILGVFPTLIGDDSEHGRPSWTQRFER